MLLIGAFSHCVAKGEDKRHKKTGNLISYILIVYCDLTIIN